MSDKKKKKEDSIKAVRWGWWLTGAIVISIVTMVFLKTGSYCFFGFNCEFSTKPITKLSFNEVGDTLAGFAGALAFVWIVVAVFMQQKDLQAQRKDLELTHRELELTREVMKEQLKAASAQADAAIEQTKMLRTEQKERREKKSGELLDQYFLTILSLSSNYYSAKIEHSNLDSDGNKVAIMGNYTSFRFFPKPKQLENQFSDIASKIDIIARQFESTLELTESILAKNVEPLKLLNFDLVKNRLYIADIFSNVLELKGHLNSVDSEKFKRSNILKFAFCLNNLGEVVVKHPDFTQP